MGRDMRQRSPGLGLDAVNQITRAVPPTTRLWPGSFIFHILVLTDEWLLMEARSVYSPTRGACGFGNKTKEEKKEEEERRKKGATFIMLIIQKKNRLPWM